MTLRLKTLKRCACVYRALLFAGGCADRSAFDRRRSIYHAATEGTFHLAQDGIGSIANPGDAGNFTARDYEKSVFYEFCIRKR